MDQDLYANCPTCHGKKHVPTEHGLSRCPDCFIVSKVSRVLRSKGFPPHWAAEFNLHHLSQHLGHNAPAVVGLGRLLDGSSRAIHFHGLPSENKQSVFAVVLTSLISNFGNVTVYDTAELASSYFGNRVSVSYSKNPAIFTLGKEIEPKLGAFYFRSIIEHCSPRRVPMVLFTDGSPLSMSGRYPDFMDLYKMAKFSSFEITGAVDEV